MSRGAADQSVGTRKVAYQVVWFEGNYEAYPHKDYPRPRSARPRPGRAKSLSEDLFHAAGLGVDEAR
jgi:hypothetical protein